MSDYININKLIENIWRVEWARVSCFSVFWSRADAQQLIAVELHVNEGEGRAQNE